MRLEMKVVRLLAGAAACAVVAACGRPSYEADAIAASSKGDQKAAARLAEKEVARFATPDQCSPAKTVNCGTLALAYGSLAEYQILAGDRAAGEISFGRARGALALMDRTELPSATGMVYRDVSEAFWKMGDQARAKTVIEEGRAAGGDGWLLTSSAGQAILQERAPARGASDTR